jgi:hypothetical protein
VCDTFPLVDEESVAALAELGCTMLVGDLHIFNLPPSINEDVLIEAFSSIIEVRGVVYVSNNQYLSSLSFLWSVSEIAAVQLENNPNLVDATLGSGLTLVDADATVVRNCPALCHSRYPLSNTTSSGNLLDCHSLNAVVFYSLNIDSSKYTLDSAKSCLRKVIRFLSPEVG